MANKKKIAILGGGAGAMAAAFSLTNEPGWDEQYEVTVYQLGWRLGGKGASGRKAAVSQRIEEHGIHLWFGFYENAFWLIRQAYDELAARNLAPGSPFQSWRDAFMPQRGGGFLDLHGSDWWQLSFELPLLPGEPGEKEIFDNKGEPPSPWKFAVTSLDRMVDHYEKHMPEAGRAAHADHEIPEWVMAITREVGVVLRALAATPLHLARDLAHRLDENPKLHSALHRHCLIHLLERFFGRFFASLGERLNKDLHLLAMVLDFGITSILGMLRDGVMENGFYSIDGHDLIDWLAAHGSHHPDSPFVLSIYDAVFAYSRGAPDRSNRKLSAATALYGNALMTLSYRGSIAWRMRAGMGDAIFAPIYLVLAKRGVRFEFFHRVKELKLDAGRTLVEQIEMDVQAETTSGAPYQPLTPVKSLPCWPSAPLYDQLVQGAEIQGGNYNLESAWTEWHDRLPGKALQRGVDFDDVVLGISLGALRWICPELIAADDGWRDMVEHVGTVQTQAMQLWLNRTAAEMGAAGKPDSAALFTSYLEPFDTYADFSHLIEREGWPAEANVQQIAYFCNALEDATTIPAPFTDPDFPSLQQSKVTENARRFLSESIRAIWPNGTEATSPEFDRSALVSEFYRANIDPSERYVLSLPGSSKYRLKPEDSHFANLYLAGDWTCTGLNWGCVESAVMSGMMASQAICGYPRHVYGAGRAKEAYGTP